MNLLILAFCSLVGILISRSLGRFIANSLRSRLQIPEDIIKEGGTLWVATDYDVKNTLLIYNILSIGKWVTLLSMFLLFAMLPEFPLLLAFGPALVNLAVSLFCIGLVPHPLNSVQYMLYCTHATNNLYSKRRSKLFTHIH